MDKHALEKAEQEAIRNGAVGSGNKLSKYAWLLDSEDSRHRVSDVVPGRTARWHPLSRHCLRAILLM